MVDFSAPLPRLPNGEPDLDMWLDRASGLSSAKRRQAVAVFKMVSDPAARTPGLMLVELLLQLRLDIVAVMAGMALFAVQQRRLEPDALPPPVAALVQAVLRLAATNVLALHDPAVLASESKSQADNARQLLLALIDDPRVAVLKLAERVVALRRSQADHAARQLAAQEAMAFFAPLAGRLGIWQLKWALEDLAFRHLYPTEYQDIADNLDGRREARERQVEAIRQDLAFRLTAAGISDAEVQGRAKHIYSIWNKMSYKAVGFTEVYDVQAVRVLVPDVDTCYRVLGIVHRSWPPIPSEIDDYIANPKANGYRSIHTAVVGPAGKTLEVQIRTRTMHEESELGMCAHWAYKDETNGTGDGPPADASGSQKIDWLRSLLEWQEEQREVAGAAAGVASTAPVFRGQDRVFVTTPQGHVLDLAPGATPVDFAYRIHTEIGHRCRGARIDGRQVPLNTRLNTGECVEIETADSAAPQREWLNPLLGYVRTARARSKIQSWFRDQSAASNIEAGETLLEAAVGANVDLARLAQRAGYRSRDALLLAVGVGEQLADDLAPLLAPPGSKAKQRKPATTPPAMSPPSERQQTERTLGLTVTGRDRGGLLRDVTAAVAGADISLLAATANAEPNARATITLALRLAEADRLDEVVAAIAGVEGVAEVRRSDP